MALQVKYCGVCGFPSEYCSFGTSYDKCKKWMAENAPEYLPKEDSTTTTTTTTTGDITDKVGSLSVADGEQGESKKSLLKGGVPPPTDSDVKILPGGKIKKKDLPSIIIAKTQRNKRKYITTVSGLEAFGIKLSEASKLFSKKFSCGASVVKNPTGTEEIDVQGDVSEDMVDFILEKWTSVDSKSIYLLEDGKKARAR